MSTTDLTPDTINYLQHNLLPLHPNCDNTTSLKEEETQALRQTEAAEQANTTGVYVYALPHYLRYPYDPQDGRTLLKVGCSENSTVKRFLEQTRTTALPEEPVLLRIYAASDARAAEKKFHAVLAAFDHSKEVERTAGTEWFLTTVGHLDTLATAFGLPVDVVSDFGASD